MIHEFAVEPEVMATWDYFRILWDDFGVGRGRLLVEFPGSWRKQVYKLAQNLTGNKPVRANALCSKLADPNQRLRLVGPGGRAFDSQRAWLDNAQAQQTGAQPFRAIVATKNLSGRADVLPAAELVRDAEPWKVPTQANDCPRVATELVRRLATLLRHSRELVLIDRNFKPEEPRFQRPFEAFVAQHANWKRLELHTAKPDPCDLEIQRDNYRRNLDLRVPTGTTLAVCFWPGLPEGQKMHPRYVLTERGGALIERGLDEGESAMDTTLVALLEHGVFLQLRQDYHEDGRTFGVPEVIRIQGRG